MKIVSWNIAGGHKIASLGHFDYQPEEISYFANEIKKLDPDIVCLQESHTKKDGSKSNAEDLANELGMSVIVNSANSPSHIESGFMLGNAIISKFKAKDVKTEYYPDPEGQLYWPDGRKADTHKKNLQFVSFDKFNITNTQMLPIKLFGFAYDDGGKGSDLAREINSVVKKMVKTPVVWCGDFNFYEPLDIYPFLKEIGLKEALPDVTTRPTKDGTKKKSDHIFYSPEFKLLDAKVIKTETDHYLCYSEFGI